MTTEFVILCSNRWLKIEVTFRGVIALANARNVGCSCSHGAALPWSTSFSWQCNMLSLRRPVHFGLLRPRKTWPGKACARDQGGLGGMVKACRFVRISGTFVKKINGPLEKNNLWTKLPSPSPARSLASAFERQSPIIFCWHGPTWRKMNIRFHHHSENTLTVAPRDQQSNEPGPAVLKPTPATSEKKRAPPVQVKFLGSSAATSPTSTTPSVKPTVVHKPTTSPPPPPAKPLKKWASDWKCRFWLLIEIFWEIKKCIEVDAPQSDCLDFKWLSWTLQGWWTSNGAFRPFASRASTSQPFLALLWDSLYFYWRNVSWQAGFWNGAVYFVADYFWLDRNVI